MVHEELHCFEISDSYTELCPSVHDEMQPHVTWVSPAADGQVRSQVPFSHITFFTQSAAHKRWSNHGTGNSSHGRRPLAPRSQQSFKARQRLPLLQPLAIARRSLDEWPRSGSDDIGEWPLPSTPSERDTNSNSERLNLDLSNIHKNPEINAGLVRREKIAFFDKECSKVAEHVFLGGDAVAKDKDILKQNGITHVLNCVGFVCPEYFQSDFVYQTLWLHGSPSEDITSILYDVFGYFEDVREKHGRGFVHC
ncbi:hypothetical protein T459_33838 [Capsicum annuum]|uniref:Protein-tyrosine-phosphatase MKP1 n=1 Tax=Capsicum annuum TaxID=4072 RepID=A0A2G2XY07_CAPAN|nr:hypothetical protein T459_33838 [Capsicum annuum]